MCIGQDANFNASDLSDAAGEASAFCRPCSLRWQDQQHQSAMAATMINSKLGFDTEYDRAKVPPYNGNDPGSLKTLLSGKSSCP